MSRFLIFTCLGRLIWRDRENDQSGFSVYLCRIFFFYPDLWLESLSKVFTCISWALQHCESSHIKRLGGGGCSYTTVDDPMLTCSYTFPEEFPALRVWWCGNFTSCLAVWVFSRLDFTLCRPKVLWLVLLLFSKSKNRLKEFSSFLESFSQQGFYRLDFGLLPDWSSEFL